MLTHRKWIGGKIKIKIRRRKTIAKSIHVVQNGEKYKHGCSNFNEIILRKSLNYYLNLQSSQSHNTAAYDTYQNQERSFTVTHDRYEPVTFDNQNGLLLFPNKNIEYCRQQIVANIKPSVHLVCGIEGLELTGTQCEMHDKRSITKVWFNCSEDFILQNDDGFLSVFSIDQTGHCELDSPDEQPVIDESVLCPCSLSKLGSLIGSAYSVNGQTLIRCPCSRSTEGSLKSKSLSADVVTCPCVSMKPKADEVICPCDVRNFERQFVVKQNWIGKSLFSHLKYRVSILLMVLRLRN